MDSQGRSILAMNRVKAVRRVACCTAMLVERWERGMGERLGRWYRALVWAVGTVVPNLKWAELLAQPNLHNPALWFFWKRWSDFAWEWAASSCLICSGRWWCAFANWSGKVRLLTHTMIEWLCSYLKRICLGNPKVLFKKTLYPIHHSAIYSHANLYPYHSFCLRNENQNILPLPQWGGF